MTIWLPIVLVVMPALGSLLHSLLFKPWRVKPLYRFLYVRSVWYRRWCWRRHIRSMKKMTRALCALVPTTKRAAEEIRKFAVILDTPEMREALSDGR